MLPARGAVGIVGLGSDGRDGIDAGVHLRWAFRREMGFPTDGFCLYRRPAIAPKLTCVKVSGETRAEGAPPGLRARTVSSSPRTRAPYARSGARWTRRVPPTRTIAVRVTAPRGSRLVVEGLLRGRSVSRVDRAGRGRSERIELHADAMDQVVVAGEGVRVTEVCHALPEDPRNGGGWKEVLCPICLPVDHREYRCGGKCAADLVAERLPEGGCERARFDAATLREIDDALRTLVDPSLGPGQADRLLQHPLRSETCTEDDGGGPALQMAALDMLLLAAIDPAVARLLGLYHVDEPPAEDERYYDYKIVGRWREGTRWSPRETVTFESREEGEVVPPVAVESELTFLSSRFGRIVRTPTNPARVERALQVTEDPAAWETFGVAVNRPEPALRVEFPRTVGTVQAFVRHGGGGVRMDVVTRTGRTTVASGTQRDALLQADADDIVAIEIHGDLRLLYALRYDVDRFQAGEHSAIAYRLRVERAARVVPPSGVSAIAIGGTTRKDPDCAPPLEGGLRDTRHVVGLRWTRPAAPDDLLLARDPILFHVEREDPDGLVHDRTGDRPRLVSPPEPDATQPPAWGTKRIALTDVVPAPGAYRYRLAGTDLFGRRSRYGPWARVAVGAAAPPPPAGLRAKWLDPRDPFLTTTERAWLDDGTSPGLLLGWDWTTALSRQAPDLHSFVPLVHPGWLNLLIARVEAVHPAGSEIELDLLVDRDVPAAALVGCTATLAGSPYHVLSHPASAGHPRRLRVRCSVPRSGVPAAAQGAMLAIPLAASLAGEISALRASPSGAEVVLATPHLLAQAPAGGFAGGMLRAVGQTWPVLSGALAPAAGTTPAKIALAIPAPPSDLAGAGLVAGSRTELLLPPGPLASDFGSAAAWAHRLPNVPAEGPGDYEVFVRRPTAGEVDGTRVPVAPRRHRLLVDERLLSEGPIRYAQAALACLADGIVGGVSPPASVVDVARDTPASVGAGAGPGTPRTYASPPGPDGRASHVHRWPATAAATSDRRYVVLRAFDHALFDLDRRIGARRSARTDWQATLALFPAVNADARRLLVDRPAGDPDYAALDDDLLQVLASFPDMADAFSALHAQPVADDDPAIRDRSLDAPPPGAAPYAPRADWRAFVDATIPSAGRHACFYRVRALDAAGNASPLSPASRPVWLANPPAAPRLIDARPPNDPPAPRDKALRLRWVHAAASGAKRYRIYRADSLRNAASLATMTLVATVAAGVGARAEMAFDDLGLPGLVERHYRLVALSDEGWPSAASDVRSGRTLDDTRPARPVWVSLAPDAAGNVDLQWTLADATHTPLVQRRPADSREGWSNLTGWLAAGAHAARDERREASVRYLYRLRVLDAAGRTNRDFDEREV